MEEKGFVRLEGRARKKKLAPRRLSKAEFDGDAPDDIGDNDTNDGEDEEDESHPIYDLSSESKASEVRLWKMYLHFAVRRCTLRGEG